MPPGIPGTHSTNGTPPFPTRPASFSPRLLHAPLPSTPASLNLTPASDAPSLNLTPASDAPSDQPERPLAVSLVSMIKMAS